jgi:hypothetical protein
MLAEVRLIRVGENEACGCYEKQNGDEFHDPMMHSALHLTSEECPELE